MDFAGRTGRNKKSWTVQDGLDGAERAELCRTDWMEQKELDGAGRNQVMMSHKGYKDRKMK